ncbi:MAG: hypothetical protein HY896_13060 [Deltaproteobacteria bacterium]|nr:hypothetical protein [Deltaproteobacteria bacterium]
MRPVTVYRVDYAKKTRVVIGTVIERRGKDRGNNLKGLLFLARKMFSSTPQEAFLTALDWQEARMAQGPGGQALPSQ